MSAPVAPTTFAWSTNSDYAAGSEIGTPTKSAPPSGRIADGWSPETKPAAQEFNWVVALIAQWIGYLAYWVNLTNVAVTEVVSLSTCTPTQGSPVLNSATPRYWSDASNSWSVILAIPIEAGWTLTDVTFEFSSTASHEGGCVLAGTDMTGAETVIALLGENTPATGTRTYSLSVTNAGTTQTLLTPTAIDGTKSIDLLLGPFGAGDKLTGVKITKTPTTP